MHHYQHSIENLSWEQKVCTVTFRVAEVAGACRRRTQKPLTIDFLIFCERGLSFETISFLQIYAIEGIHWAWNARNEGQIPRASLKTKASFLSSKNKRNTALVFPHLVIVIASFCPTKDLLWFFECLLMQRYWCKLGNTRLTKDLSAWVCRCFLRLTIL